jgi:hypothetical protein
MLTREKHINLGHALGKGAGSAVAFCLAVTVIWPVGALLAYHMRVSGLFFLSLKINQESSPSLD